MIKHHPLSIQTEARWRYLCFRFQGERKRPIAELEPGTERLRLMITKPIRMPWWNLSDSAIFFALEMVGMQSSAIASWDLQIRRKWLPPPKGWWQLRTRPLVAWIFNATWPSHKMLEAKKKGRLIYNLNIEIHTAPWFLAVLHIVFHRKSLSTAGRCTPSNCEPLNFPLMFLCMFCLAKSLLDMTK